MPAGRQRRVECILVAAEGSALEEGGEESGGGGGGSERSSKGGRTASDTYSKLSNDHNRKS